MLSLLAASIAHSKSHVGFNYAFDSLSSSAEEKKTKDMHQAILSVLAQCAKPGTFFAIQLLFPLFRLIVSISLYKKEGKSSNYPLFYSQLVAPVLLVGLSKKSGTLDINSYKRGRLPSAQSAILTNLVS